MSAGAYAKRGEVWLVDLGYAAKTRPRLQHRSRRHKPRADNGCFAHDKR